MKSRRKIVKITIKIKISFNKMRINKWLNKLKNMIKLVDASQIQN